MFHDHVIRMCINYSSLAFVLQCVHLPCTFFFLKQYELSMQILADKIDLKFPLHELYVATVVVVFV